MNEELEEVGVPSTMTVKQALRVISKAVQYDEGDALEARNVIEAHIARVEAERDALQERLDDIGPVRTIV